MNKKEIAVLFASFFKQNKINSTIYYDGIRIQNSDFKNQEVGYYPSEILKEADDYKITICLKQKMEADLFEKLLEFSKFINCGFRNIGINAFEIFTRFY